jgi:uncharacterized membrane protein YhaH (DUF805 family)
VSHLGPFRFQGRIGRRHYLFFFLALTPIVVVGGFVAIAAGAGPPDNILSWILLAVLGITSLLVVVAFASFTVRRLHDLGASGWWLSIAPLLATLATALKSPLVWQVADIVSIAALALLLLIPGTRGRNRYGEGRLSAR